MNLRTLLSRLFRIEEYRGVALNSESIPEELYLNGQRIDNKCGLFCLNPLVFVLWELSESNYKALIEGRQNIDIKYKGERKVIGQLVIDKISELRLPNSTVVFTDVVESNLNYVKNFRDRFRLNLIQLLKHGGKFQLTSKKIKNLAAIYAIPRKVWLTVVEEGDTSFVFPMDFHGKINNDLYCIGLQRTNPAYLKILGLKRWKVFDVPFESRDELYSSGSVTKFQSDHSEEHEKVIRSRFKPLKKITIELIGSQELGSHNFIYGSICAEEVYSDFSNQMNLFHIHQLYARYKDRDKSISVREHPGVFS